MIETQIFQIGSVFPDISLSELCFTPSESIKKLELMELKNKVWDYLTTHKKSSISELAETFKVQPSKIVAVVRELENEGLTKESD